jgi:hypothetical protein
MITDPDVPKIYSPTDQEHEKNCIGYRNLKGTSSVSTDATVMLKECVPVRPA